MVIAADETTVTTVGGNEFGAVSAHRCTPAEVPGVVGFVRL
ncbi:hypothetical protein ACWEO2_32330 [Nocardia sp. NPDC004278]